MTASMLSVSEVDSWPNDLNTLLERFEI